MLEQRCAVPDEISALRRSELPERLSRSHCMWQHVRYHRSLCYLLIALIDIIEQCGWISMNAYNISFVRRQNWRHKILTCLFILRVYLLFLLLIFFASCTLVYCHASLLIQYESKAFFPVSGDHFSTQWKGNVWGAARGKTANMAHPCRVNGLSLAVSPP